MFFYSEMAHAMPSAMGEGIPTAGISRAGLVAFMTRCGGRSALQGLTTADVCEKIIKPMTVDVSYCTMAVGDPSTAMHIGKANAFVSHTWGVLFLDSLDSLLDWTPLSSAACPASLEKRGTGSSSGGNSPDMGEEVFFWFDLFSNSQHDVMGKDFDWWTKVFSKNVQDIGRLVLILQWADPIPLRRAWCIWEVACALSTHGRLEICLSKSEDAAFLSTLCTDFDSIFHKLCLIDVRSATAQKEEDKISILAAIERTVGAVLVNTQVLNKIQEWMAASCVRAMSALSPTAALISPIAMNYCRLLLEMSHFSEADELSASILLACQHQLSPLDVLTLNALHLRGNFFYKTGLLSGSTGVMQEAARHFELAVEGRRLVLGYSHKDTLLSLSLYGTAKLNLDELGSAESALHEALLGQVSLPGGDSLAATYFTMGMWAEVQWRRHYKLEAMYECTRAYEGMLRVLGENHPDTMMRKRISAGWLTMNAWDTGGLERAEVMYRELLDGMKVVLGERHPVSQRK